MSSRSGSPLTSIGLVVAPHKEAVLPSADSLVRDLMRLGVDVRCEPEVADALGMPDTGCEMSELVRTDLVLVLGGDGTFLHCARLAAPLGTPLLGVYVGGFGFLTEMDAASLLASLPGVVSGGFDIEERMLLQVALTNEDGSVIRQCALNEVAVHRGPVAGLLACALTLDGELVGEYRGDGVIVATPTGSTAYSLSAGGPVIHPEVSALVITPMLQHTLNIRPLVVSTEHAIEMRLTGGYWAIRRGATVSSDGENLGLLEAGGTLAVSRAGFPLRVARMGGGSFLGRLQQKLGWGAEG
jgi:NAD+ kinase